MLFFLQTNVKKVILYKKAKNVEICRKYVIIVWRQKIKGEEYSMGKKKVLKNIVNLIILLLSTELINIILKEVPEFSNIDFRLIFIFIIANYMGMKFGIVSAILASVLYIIQTYSGVLDPSIIFLNTNNWLRIAIYLAFAIIIGLKHDKDNLKINSLNNIIDEYKEKEELNNKRIVSYENELKEFNQVLLTHKNTYIQVSKFIQQIVSVKHDNTKISNYLKSILDNETCEFTNIQTIKKFLDNGNMTTVGNEHIWINKELSNEEPCYIAPISIESQDFAIVIWKCNFEQMNTDYRNQIIGISKIMKYVLSH